MYKLISNFWFIPLPHLHSPFGNHTFVFYLWIYFCFVNKFVSCFRFHIWAASYICLSVWFTSPSRIIFRSIHVAANSITSFFLMTNIPLCVCVCCVCICTYIFIHSCQWTFRLPPHLATKIMLLWTLGCMYLFELELLSFPDIVPGVGLLDHMITLFLVF